MFNKKVFLSPVFVGALVFAGSDELFAQEIPEQLLKITLDFENILIYKSPKSVKDIDNFIKENVNSNKLDNISFKDINNNFDKYIDDLNILYKKEGIKSFYEEASSYIKDVRKNEYKYDDLSQSVGKLIDFVSLGNKEFTSIIKKTDYYTNEDEFVYRYNQGGKLANDIYKVIVKKQEGDDSAKKDCNLNKFKKIMHFISYINRFKSIAFELNDMLNDLKNRDLLLNLPENNKPEISEVDCKEEHTDSQTDLPENPVSESTLPTDNANAESTVTVSSEQDVNTDSTSSQDNKPEISEVDCKEEHTDSQTDLPESAKNTVSESTVTVSSEQDVNTDSTSSQDNKQENSEVDCKEEHTDSQTDLPENPVSESTVTVSSKQDVNTDSASSQDNKPEISEEDYKKMIKRNARRSKGLLFGNISTLDFAHDFSKFMFNGLNYPKDENYGRKVSAEISEQNINVFVSATKKLGDINDDFSTFISSTLGTNSSLDFFAASLIGSVDYKDTVKGKVGLGFSEKNNEYFIISGLSIGADHEFLFMKNGLLNPFVNLVGTYNYHSFYHYPLECRCTGKHYERLSESEFLVGINGGFSAGIKDSLIKNVTLSPSVRIAAAHNNLLNISDFSKIDLQVGFGSKISYKGLDFDIEYKHVFDYKFSPKKHIVSIQFGL